MPPARRRRWRSSPRKAPASAIPRASPKRVTKTLAHELEIIAGREYAPYFLTVHDIVRFARGEGILCQGRGSAAQFRRLLLPRHHRGRPEPRQPSLRALHLAEPQRAARHRRRFRARAARGGDAVHLQKYTRDRAGIAATVITYRTRSAVRDVGKVFGLSEDAIGALASTTWGWSSDGVRDADVRRAGLDPTEPTMRQVLELCRRAHRLPAPSLPARRRLRHDARPPRRDGADHERGDGGSHPRRMGQGRPRRAPHAEGRRACPRHAHLHPPRLRLHRRALRRAMDAGDAPQGGACHLPHARPRRHRSASSRSRAARRCRCCRASSRRSFYDLVIEVAIVRPGPIQGDMVHPYLRRRQGIEKVDYPSPSPEHGPTDELKKILERTLGVPLFQEQAMKIAMEAAKFSAAEADGLRRAMATFRRNGTIGTFQSKMIDGMTRRGYTQDFAERSFRQIEGFGDYGFPREPRRELRPPRLCLGVDQGPLPGRLLRRAAELPAHGLLRPGPDRPRRRAPRRHGPAARRQSLRLGFEAGSP